MTDFSDKAIAKLREMAAAHTAMRVDKRPLRRKTALSLPNSQPTKVAKFDGTRTGKRYTGHIWADDGTQGDAIQWLFDWGNDVGTSSVIGANEYVQVVKCPTWLETNAAYGTVATYGEKYVAVAPIWGVLA